MKFTVSVAMCEPEHYLEVARAAEACGWDAVAVPDSVFYPETVSAPYPYTDDGGRFWPADTPFLDPFVAIPAMAAATERIRFYTNVLKTAIREPLLVAKTVTSAAVLAPGRIGVGVGLSWIPEEFTWLHQDMRTRGKRLDETIEILRLAFAGGWFEYHGRYYDFDRLLMAPEATEPIPLYVGGLSEAGLRRASRCGDGWISVMNSPDELREIVAKLTKYRDEYGRSEEPFEIAVTPVIPPTLDAHRELVEIGVTDVITIPWLFYGGDQNSLETKLSGIERFSEEIIDPLRP